MTITEKKTDQSNGNGEATAATRADVCVAAAAELFRGNGELIATGFGVIPAIGVRLARETFAPDLMISDGEAHMLRGRSRVGHRPEGEIEAWTPYRTIFDLVWHGKRHVVMMPSQIDGWGNANISAIGDYRAPKVQLLGVRGAPGNTISHRTSYWVPQHSTRAFVPTVDMVSGVGHDRAAAAGPAAKRYHHLVRVLTNLAVLDFADDGRLRLASVHPGVSVGEVRGATGCELFVPQEVPITQTPNQETLALIAELDPKGLRHREVPQ